MKLIELQESLDSVYPFKIKRQTVSNFAAMFETPDGAVHVSITKSEDIWELVFVREILSPLRGKLVTTTAKTSQGNPLQVFATVIAIAKEFVDQYHPDTVEFTAEKEDGNRSSLYTRLIKRHLPEGYEVVADHKGDYRSIFTLKRKD